MTLYTKTTIIILLATFLSVQSAKILCIMPLPSYSHQIMFRPFWTELLKNGHELTLLTTDPMTEKHPNLTQIDFHFAYEIKNNKYKLNQQLDKMGLIDIVKMITLYTNYFTELVLTELSHPEVQKLINDKKLHFDLVINEYYLPEMAYFSHHFDCPFIGVASTELSTFQHEFLGNYVNPVLYPELFLPFHGKLSFFKRVISTSYVLFVKLIYFFPNEENFRKIQEHFPKKLPNVWDLAKNVSLIFVNVNPAFYLRPIGPATIPIGGGAHLLPPKKLPDDLQKFLDSSKNGVIYFSLGSSVKSTDLSNEIINEFLGAFKELPFDVLWKFENSFLENMPKNVRIQNWIPQQDVLRHKNIKAFITQGGLQSMEEAILSRVPMIGIAFFSDQKMNVKKIETLNIGVSINRHKITKDVVKNAILEVCHNTIYKKNIAKVALLTEDQPMSGLEKAVWWTEYVLRHKGAPHFRSPAFDVPKYQLNLIDVYAFLIFVTLILCYVVFKLLKLMLRIILRIVIVIKKEKIKNE